MPITDLYALGAVLYSVGGVALGLLSLTLNGVRGSESARRKTRVIVWGTLLGVAPMFVLQVTAVIRGREPFEMSFWLWAPSVMALFLVPLSIAYAVLKHRVLDVPVLLRRGARYLLVQRGAVGLLVLFGCGSTLAFADSVAGYLDTPSALPAAAVGGAAFGGLLIWAGSSLHRRLRGRIDRAFFRGSYDARHVLQHRPARRGPRRAARRARHPEGPAGRSRLGRRAGLVPRHAAPGACRMLFRAVGRAPHGLRPRRARAGAPRYYTILVQFRGLIEFLVTRFDWLLFRMMVRYPEEFPRIRARLSRPGRLTAGFNYYRANLRLLFPGRLPQVTAPVVGIWSDGDVFLTERQMLRSEVFCDAGWTYHRLEGCNHWLQLDAPEALNPLLLEQLR